MTQSLETLLDTLATYPATEDAACFTLPPAAYTDPDLYALETERIFRREWILIGRANDIANPGDWFTFQILDDPLLIVRGQDGVVRAFSQCVPPSLHAGSRWTKRGNDKRFVCAYHGWVYGTDGRLVGAPLMEGSLGFDKTRCALPEYRLENLARFHLRQPRRRRAAADATAS